MSRLLELCLTKTFSRDNQEGSDDDDMEGAVNVIKIISVAEAQKIVQKLKDYCMQSDDIDNKTFSSL